MRRQHAHRRRVRLPGRGRRQVSQCFELGGPVINQQPSRFDHVCYRTDTGFTVIDVWEDEASFNAFGPIIGQRSPAAGLDPKPIICPLGATMGRDGKQVVYSAA